MKRKKKHHNEFHLDFLPAVCNKQLEISIIWFIVCLFSYWHRLCTLCALHITSDRSHWLIYSLGQFVVSLALSIFWFAIAVSVPFGMCRFKRMWHVAASVAIPVKWAKNQIHDCVWYGETDVVQVMLLLWLSTFFPSSAAAYAWYCLRAFFLLVTLIKCRKTKRL